MALGTTHRTTFPVREQLAGVDPEDVETKATRDHLSEVARGLNIAAGGVMSIKPYDGFHVGTIVLASAADVNITGAVIDVRSDIPCHVLLGYVLNVAMDSVTPLAGAEFVRAGIQRTRLIPAGGAPGTITQSFDYWCGPPLVGGVVRATLKSLLLWAGPFAAKEAWRFQLRASIQNRVAATVAVVHAHLVALTVPRVPGG